jgi:hypothetical protein
MDYKRWNAAAIRNNATLPRLAKALYEPAGAKYFPCLDLHNEDHQLRIAAENVPKTSSKTHMGQLICNVLPFGLSNAPATIQSSREQDLCKVNARVCCHIRG